MSSATSKIKITPHAKPWKIVISQSKYLEYIMEDKFDKDGSGLFAILDGHGGN